MPYRHRTSVAAAAIWLCATCAGQSPTERMDRQVRAYVENGWFSGTVLVAKQGDLLLKKAYGTANHEWDVANTIDTKFRIGSMTKQFTATCIMQLEEKGLLSVNDPVTKHLPDYPETGHKVTIHHLLTHTSGVPNYTFLPGFQNEQRYIPHTIASMLALFKDKDLEFEPGSKWKYSNSGYVLLAAIVEKVSGQSFQEYLREHVLDPLGMSNTGVDTSTKLLSRRASGYAVTDDGLERAQHIDISVHSGAGAMYSTVEDLYKWDRALYTEKVVKSETLQRMYTPVKNGYGYGWIVKEADGRPLVTHSGGLAGFRSTIIRLPEDDVCVIVLCNLETAVVGRMSQELMSLALGKDVDPPKKPMVPGPDRTLLQRYVGVYEMTPEFKMTVTMQADRLYIQATGQRRFPLFAESSTKFFMSAVAADVEFVEEDGEVTKLILFQSGREMAAKKVK